MNDMNDMIWISIIITIMIKTTTVPTPTNRQAATLSTLCGHEATVIVLLGHCVEVTICRWPVRREFPTVKGKDPEISLSRSLDKGRQQPSRSGQRAARERRTEIDVRCFAIARTTVGGHLESKTVTQQLGSNFHFVISANVY